MLLLMVAACTPWSDVAEREAVWWGPTDQLEQTAGVDLVELPMGEPVGYWPRVVIGRDRIDVDNRAWFLSLPDEVFASSDREKLEALLVEREGLVPVSGGAIDPSHKRGQLVSELYDALLGMAVAQRDLEMETGGGVAFRGEILIVPAPGTSASTLREVLFSAGQAMYGGLAVAGASEGRVRSAMGFDGADCALSIPLFAVDGGAHLGSDHVGLRGPKSCPTPPIELPPLARSIVQACRSRLDEAAQRVAARHPGKPLPDPAEWRCARVDAFLDSGTAADLLPAIASLHAAHPEVRHGYWLGGIGTPPDDCSKRVELSALSAEQLGELCAPGVIERYVEDLMEGGRGRLWSIGEERTGDIDDLLDGLEEIDTLEGLVPR